MDYARYLGETMGYGIDDQWLDQRVKSGASLIMFDGLDEIFDPERRDHVMKQIVGFTETYPLARVIVTSRPHGYHEGIFRPAGFIHYRLQDLDRQQKENFTRVWFNRVFPGDFKNARQRIDRVLSSVDRSPSVRWLAGNPLLLTIMCLIARERELPEERAEFYEQCLDVLVHQWEVNNHLQVEDLAFLTVYRKKDLLRKIAFEMQASQAGLRGNFIAEEQLLKITQVWFEDNFPDLQGTKSERAAQQMVQGLWQRNYILCPRGPRLYGFLHRTFMEFLTAKEYALRFEKTDEFTLENLNRLFYERGTDPEWSEVLRLICGEIGDEYAERMIRTLLISNELPKDELTNENQPNHLLLGIRCMNELRGLSKRQSLGEFTLGKCIEFMQCLAHYWPINDFCEELISSISEVGTKWPNANKLMSGGIKSVKYKYAGYQLYPEIEAAILRDRNRAEALVNFKGHLGGGWEDGMRNRALIALNRWWPDERTRNVLEMQALNYRTDNYFSVRAKAIELLAGNDEWADEATRQLLTQCALEDSDSETRVTALDLLSRNADWADEATRQLLMQRAVSDPSGRPRSKALELLAGNDEWEDEATQQDRKRVE